MKRIALASLITIVLLITATGCTGGVSDETPVADSCVTCHTDEDTLQAVASPEEEETSEATSGEG